jgi:hypothetical protein
MAATIKFDALVAVPVLVLNRGVMPLSILISGIIVNLFISILPVKVVAFTLPTPIGLIVRSLKKSSLTVRPNVSVIS